MALPFSAAPAAFAVAFAAFAVAFAALVFVTSGVPGTPSAAAVSCLGAFAVARHAACLLAKLGGIDAQLCAEVVPGGALSAG